MKIVLFLIFQKKYIWRIWLLFDLSLISFWLGRSKFSWSVMSKPPFRIIRGKFILMLWVFTFIPHHHVRIKNFRALRMLDSSLILISTRRTLKLTILLLNNNELFRLSFIYRNYFLLIWRRNAPHFFAWLNILIVLYNTM